VNTDTPWSGELEEYISGIMDEHQVPGLALAVLKDDEIIYARGFGYRDRSRRLRVDEETVFGIASVTKSFTAAAIMKLVDDGVLSVNDPVVEHLPEFRVPDEEALSRITIRDFMAHLSGIPPQPNLGYAMRHSMRGYPKYNPHEEDSDEDQGDEQDEPVVETYEDLMEQLADGYDLLGSPGEWLSYSNDAYALLGAIIERASGQLYESFVSEHILEPNGMSRTTFFLDDLVSMDNVTRLYMKNIDDEVMDVPRYQEASSLVACGFLRSCATDLVRYGRMYLGRGTVDGRQLLSAESVLEMETPVFPTTPKSYYGYGLTITPDYHGRTLVEHGGSLTGVSSRFGYVPEEGLACAVLMNLSGAPADKVWLAAVNLALGLPVDSKRIEYPQCELPASELERFTGVYRAGEGQDITIELDDGELWAQAMGERHSLRPTAPDKLVVKQRGSESLAQFYFDETGKVTRAFWGLRVLTRHERGG